MKLTSTVGNFYFDDDVILNNNGGGKRVKSTRDVYLYVKTWDGSVSNVRFRYIPAPGYWIKQGLAQVVGKQHRNVPKAA